MRYAFDPELAPWVAMLPDARFEDVSGERERRRAALAGRTVYEPSRSVRMQRLAVPGPDGAPEVPVRLYLPPESTGVPPGLVYLHGGGFCFDDLDSVHDESLEIAAEVGVVAVSVGYRLAPENPFPAALDDCYAVLQWVSANAYRLGVDPTRIGVGGDSAGGGLAAALALLSRDRGGPPLCFQFLNVPALDDRMRSPSAVAFQDTPALDRHKLGLTWRYYLGPDLEPGGPGVSPYSAPARAEDLTGLPPAYVVACEFDPLRDEDIEYATRLVRAGVPTELHLYPGTFHGSTAISQAAVSRRMAADELIALRHGLHQPTDRPR